ncbi:MAG: hypothetical protein ABIH36_03915 [bacterium]
MRLCDVLSLYVDPRFRGQDWERGLSKLWGEWGVCRSCNVTIASAAEVLWSGRGGGFVHAGHIRNGDAVSWSEVKLPGDRDSVAEKLRQKKEREEAKEAQEAA